MALSLLYETLAPSITSSKARFVLQRPSPIAASALAARINGRGLRFFTRKRNSVLKIRMIEAKCTHTRTPDNRHSLMVNDEKLPYCLLQKLKITLLGMLRHLMIFFGCVWAQLRRAEI
uniref:Uncharacterized protein n=1 Tax=Ceratitis capitata TaxID=7213 RepID=W8BT68_CERCA